MKKTRYRADHDKRRGHVRVPGRAAKGWPSARDMDRPSESVNFDGVVEMKISGALEHVSNDR